ncbi:alpha-L RNA-binding motif-containing protein [Gautieria morchelliformis]|nr:alpha-L RNA-binding motif-containing protein [Gautieria morchelliformis]
MRDKNVFAHTRALPRMSWSPHNLYNLWKRSFGPKVSESTFDRTSKTLFQQRWISKRLVRAYHGDHINEKTFKRWYLPTTLPDVRPRRSALGGALSLVKWAKRQGEADQMQKQMEREAKAALAPVGSLMFSEVERRIDVFIFRCCFAHSVYEARRLVIHGNVKLNGKEHTNANTRLAPGDMVSVDPSAIRFLQRRHQSDTEVNTVTRADNVDAAPTEASQADDANAGPEGKETSQAENGDAAEAQGAEAPQGEDTTGVPEWRTPVGVPGQPWTKDLSLTPFVLPDYAAPFIFIPAYIELSFATCSAVYVRHPTARPGYSEIPTPYDADGEVVRLAWEWYAKRRPRMRSRSQLESMPDNRRTRE